MMDYEVDSDDSALIDSDKMCYRLNYGEALRHYNDDWPDENVYADSDTSDTEMEYGYE